MALTKITSSLVAINSLTAANIADNAVDATKIASNSILTRHIDDDQVTGDQLADTVAIVTSITFPDGSAAAPSITNTGDTNTGLLFPAADSISITTAGTQRTLINADGFFDHSAGANDVARFSGTNSGGLTIRNDTANQLILHTGTSDSLVFGTNGNNDRMTILSDGKVGIGTASIDNNAKLHIEDSAYPIINLDRSSISSDGNHVGYINFQNNGDVYGYIGVWVEDISETDGEIRFATQKGTSLSDKMVITSDGNVGIGLTAPLFPLHKKTTTGYIMSETTASGASAGFRLKGDASADFTLFTTQGTNQFAIYDNANTAQRFTIDSAGHITAPHQSAFSATKSASQSNIAVNGSVTITFDTEIFDQNADFASNTFTAPVTGKYQLNMTLNFGDYPNNGNYLWAGIVTSNRTIYLALNPTGSPASSNYENCTGSVLADMDANDTAYVFVIQGGGSVQTDIVENSFFSGHLAC